MKQIQLTQGEFALVDDCDYEYLMQWKWCVLKSRTRMDAVSRIIVDGSCKTIYMHRVIMSVDDSTIEVDHINHNPLDNQRSNLRACSRQQNSFNKTKQRNSFSRYKGVCRINNKSKGTIRSYWKAQIRKNDKLIQIGYFKNERDAALAYDTKAKEIFGEFANLNFK